MPTNPPAAGHDPNARRAARRTALIVGGIAIAIYVGFIVLNTVAK